MKELVRCRPCGFVIETDKLGDVCPACGLPRKVFEPYREKVSRNRLMLLGIDMHPIAIHLSQTFVVLIPVLIFFTKVFPNFKFEMFSNVLQFSVLIFPFTLMIAIITGVVDGLTRFKSLTPPLLKIKIIFSSIIIVLAFSMLFVAKADNFGLITTLLSLATLACAIRLGLWGKKLIDVILPGTYPQKKGSRIKEKEEEKKVKVEAEN